MSLYSLYKTGLPLIYGEDNVTWSCDTELEAKEKAKQVNELIPLD